MTSILKVDTIQKANGSAATASDLGIVTTSGSVLQFVSHIETGFTSFTHNSTHREDRLLLASNAADSTSHVSASITPSATNSKIFIQVCVFYEPTSSEQEILWDIYRDNVKLGSPKVGNRGGGIASAGINHVNTNSDSTPETRYYQFVDSPGSTNSITYAAAYNTSPTTGSLYLNRTVTDSNTVNYERGVSSIVLMEIAG